MYSCSSCSALCVHRFQYINDRASLGSRVFVRSMYSCSSCYALCVHSFQNINNRTDLSIRALSSLNELSIDAAQGIAQAMERALGDLRKKIEIVVDFASLCH